MSLNDKFEAYVRAWFSDNQDFAEYILGEPQEHMLWLKSLWSAFMRDHKTI